METKNNLKDPKPNNPSLSLNNDTNQKYIQKTNNNHEKNKKKQLQPSILEITSKPKTIIIYSFSIIPNFSQVGSQSSTSKLKKKKQKLLSFKKKIIFFFEGFFLRTKNWYCDGSCFYLGEENIVIFFLMVKGLNQ